MSNSKLLQDEPRIDIDRPRWDQSTYWNRAKHFLTVTNPLNVFKTSAQLDFSRDIVTRYRNGETISGLTIDDLWHQKYVYDSAHHPETGERQISFGRMAAQVPMNMLVTGCMLTFYKTTPQVIFWQWFNQSFNAMVNYTNRSGANPIPKKQLATSYTMATGSALVTALGLNSLTKSAPPLVGRFVPFFAVAAANCVNIPLMRMKEISEGIEIDDGNGNKLGKSKKAAKIAISQVIFSRISMCLPGMIIPPILMNHLEKKGTLKRYPFINAPLQIIFCGLLLLFTTPMCCAIFPQVCPIKISNLEQEIQDEAKKLKDTVKFGYYHKGL